MIFSTPSACFAAEPKETGLLFYLSGDHGFTADYAAGNPEPTFCNDIDIVKDGAKGPGFSAAHVSQLFAYDAPGNIYAQRGTFSFFWRPRDPVGKTPFHIVQIGPSDHSDLVMTWLRIDYNGEGGYDAFVSDINLACARVSYKSDTLPKADKWYHLAFAWDETKGVQLYLDGTLIGQKDTTTVFYSGLDQFGIGCRGVTPHFVGSEGNFIRGMDVDEFRIYDRMLPPDQIKRLAKGNPTQGLKPMIRSLSDHVVRDEWWLRYGWNRPGDIPPALPGREVSVRKVEIYDVYDLKQWWWKGTDGIRETTWPSVYNRSRITGRTDYIIQPDWNCYSLSGKSVTFIMPDEPWNHIEIAGAAYGSAKVLLENETLHEYEDFPLFSRPALQERTVHRIDRPYHGGKIRFDNDVQETPIGEFMAYNVIPGKEPKGITTLYYRLNGNVEAGNSTLTNLVNYINGRFLPDERDFMVALPSGGYNVPRKAKPNNMLPLVHVLIPFEFRGPETPIISLGWYKSGGHRTTYTWENMYGGLDGLAIDLPALDVTPTHGDYFPLNIKVKDPLWPDRNLLDFTFSVKPGEPKTLWLDTRDRILPNGYPLYFTIAGAGQDFGPEMLEGAEVRLIFKDYEDSRSEHEIDRFTQVRDVASHMVEPGANSKKYRIYQRFSNDISDLLRVNPHHEPGRSYWFWRNSEQQRPQFIQPEPPSGVPLWAFRQVENLKLVKHFVNWWIDKRQIENGEFGGGLSDDGDLTHQWVGAALMGVNPDKLTDSIRREMDAFYDNGMFTDGLPTIQTDELHTYEEGIQVLPQDMALSYGDPKAVERLMETARGYERITGVNKAGHRHFRSSFYSATKMADEGIWEYSYPYSYLILHAGMVLVEYNGNPAAKKIMLELADGLLAHRRKDENGNWIIPSIIHFSTDEDQPVGIRNAVHLFWAAWRWTGDEKYLLPIQDMGMGCLGYLNGNIIDLLDKRYTWGKEIASRTDPHSGNHLYSHIAWQVTGNKQYLEEYYADQIAAASRMMYINTEGHFWIDRVNVRSQELQRSRLGGIAASRNTVYPGHTVSWKFKTPADDESVAILIPDAKFDEFTVIAYNLDRVAVDAEMTAWDITPGTWEASIGRDTDNDDIPDTTLDKRTVEMQKTGSMNITFAPRSTTIVKMKLVKEAQPLWDRPDLGIGTEDITVSGNTITVNVHSLGSVDAPSCDITLVGSDGAVLSRAQIPAIDAPVDLMPKKTIVKLIVPAGKNTAGNKVIIDPDHKISEITRRNNSVAVMNR
ncbi:MAG: hypothetical protein JXB48_01075 [Candidatus Latescibacteria bacterium]|nr:hypothetical protein [Candidatus Latescibacterota bacterium]